jgi:hypothetical protein
MKSVGKPDAGNPHVRFDERGRETEQAASYATASFLDSTVALQIRPIGRCSNGHSPFTIVRPKRCSILFNVHTKVLV